MLRLTPFQSLQQGDRMVAVISDVNDLAERLPSRIQVSKAVTGSAISALGASALGGGFRADFMKASSSYELRQAC
jgi:hypothetical protein